MNESKISEGEKTFFQKYYLLFFYLFFLLLDCWFLYSKDYNNRKFSKSLLMPCLFLWFMSNTAFNMRSSPYTLLVRLLLYSVFTVTWIADICGLLTNLFLWSSCLYLYLVSYIFYLFILISINTKALSSGFVIYVKKVFPPILLFWVLAILYIYQFFGLSLNILNNTLYFQVFVITLLILFTTNMLGIDKLKRIRLVFIISIVCLILTNAIYGVDEVYFHRRHSILDVGVAINNGLSQVLMVLGIIKYIQAKIA